MHPYLMIVLALAFGLLVGTVCTPLVVLIVCAFAVVLIIAGVTWLRKEEAGLAALVGIYPLIIGIFTLLGTVVAFYLSTNQTFVQDAFVNLRFQIFR